MRILKKTENINQEPYTWILSQFEIDLFNSQLLHISAKLGITSINEKFNLWLMEISSASLSSSSSVESVAKIDCHGLSALLYIQLSVWGQFFLCQE